MIVVSAGMEKSGTGWYFNLTNAMLAGAGGSDTRQMRRANPVLSRLIRPHNCVLARASAPRLAVVAGLAPRGARPFAVKTHQPPTRGLLALARSGRVKVTYCYRDLRDVALSALDHNRRLGPDGRGRIEGIDDLEGAVAFASGLVPAWRRWMAVPGVHAVRYEDLRGDPAAELGRLAAFLGLEVTAATVEALLESYPAGAGRSDWTDGLHFNQGRAGRHRELSEDDRALLDGSLGGHLAEMGYG